MYFCCQNPRDLHDTEKFAAAIVVVLWSGCLLHCLVCAAFVLRFNFELRKLLGQWSLLGHEGPGSPPHLHKALP